MTIGYSSMAASVWQKSIYLLSRAVTIFSSGLLVFMLRVCLLCVHYSCFNPVMKY